MKLSLKILALGLVLPASSLMAQANDGPADADSWFDITVLSAKVLPNLTLKTFDHVENCDKTQDKWSNDPGVGQQHLEVFDCATYIGRQLNATIFKEVPAWTFINGSLTSGFQLDAPLVEIDTVVPLDRLMRADFLGFSEAWMGGRVDLYRAIGNDGQTREIGRVHLKDGRIGVVHRWIAVFEANGSDNGQTMRSLPFKPVLVRNQNGDQLRYWDKLVGSGMFTDYFIQNFQNNPQGGYTMTAPNSYDRSAELLQ